MGALQVPISKSLLRGSGGNQFCFFRHLNAQVFVFTWLRFLWMNISHQKSKKMCVTQHAKSLIRSHDYKSVLSTSFGSKLFNNSTSSESNRCTSCWFLQIFLIPKTSLNIFFLGILTLWIFIWLEWIAPFLPHTICVTCLFLQWTLNNQALTIVLFGKPPSFVSTHSWVLNFLFQAFRNVDHEVTQSNCYARTHTYG